MKCACSNNSITQIRAFPAEPFAYKMSLRSWKRHNPHSNLVKTMPSFCNDKKNHTVTSLCTLRIIHARVISKRDGKTSKSVVLSTQGYDVLTTQSESSPPKTSSKIQDSVTELTAFPTRVPADARAGSSSLSCFTELTLLLVEVFNSPIF